MESKALMWTLAPPKICLPPMPSFLAGENTVLLCAKNNYFDLCECVHDCECVSSNVMGLYLQSILILVVIWDLSQQCYNMHFELLFCVTSMMLTLCSS